MTTPRNFTPPPPPPPLVTIDPAEFIALRTIVVVLVGALAGQFEKSGVSASQDWINGIAEVCADAINGAEFRGLPDAERIRSEALEHVNNILGGVRFPSNTRTN